MNNKRRSKSKGGKEERAGIFCPLLSFMFQANSYFELFLFFFSIIQDASIVAKREIQLCRGEQQEVKRDKKTVCGERGKVNCEYVNSVVDDETKEVVTREKGV